MLAVCIMQEKNHIDNNSSGISPVPRSCNKQKQITAAKPKFNYKEFPSILRGIMLRSDSPANSNDYNNKYLGVLCLNNIKTCVRMYHMFYTTEKDIGKDYQATRLLHQNKPEIRIINNVTVQTICPKSLHRSAVKHFTEYHWKWNNDGNVLVTPISETDVGIMSNKLQELQKKEVQKLCNFITFLKMNKA